MTTPRFSEQLKALPTRPGVYIMRDAAAQVIYVGKATNLRNRVRSLSEPRGPGASGRQG